MFYKNFLCLFCSLLVTASFLNSASGTWTGTTDLDWNTDTNWTAAPFPDGVADVATFGPAADNATINVSGAIDLASIDSTTVTTTMSLSGSQITFNSAGTKLQGKIAAIGNTLALPAAAVTFSSTTTTFNGGITGDPTSLTLAGATTHTFASTAKAYTGGTIFTGGATLDVQTGISTSSFSGTGTVKFNNTGTPNYSGDITGAVIVDVSDSVILSGATLSYTGATTIAGTKTLDLRSNPTATSGISGTGTAKFNITGTPTSSRSITGGVILDISDSVILTGTLSYTGATTIAGTKTLELQSNPTGTSSISGTGTAKFNIAGTPTCSRNITGGVILDVTDSVALSGTLSYTGATTIAGTKTLELQSNPTGTSGISGAGTAKFNIAGNPTCSRDITGTAIVDAANNVVLSGSLSYSGATTITTGKTLEFQSNPTGTSGISGAGTAKFNITGNPTCSRNITGTAITNAANNVVLSGTLSYSGATTIATGKTLEFQSNPTGTSGISGAGTAKFNIAGNPTCDRNITGNAIVDVADSLILSGTTLSYAGATTIVTGKTLEFQSNPTGTSGISGAGTAKFNIAGTPTCSRNITGTTIVDITDSVILSGTLSYSGATTITAAKTLDLRSNLTNSDIGGAGTVKFSGGGSVTCAGNITGTNALEVVAGTTATLTGTTLSYSGTTTVPGTLDLRSTLTTSSPSVTGVFTGNGTVTNTLTNAAGGKVKPGISSSTDLTVGTYSQTGTSTLEIRVATGTASQLIVTGGATLDGDLLLTVAAGVYPKGTTFTVLTAAGGITGDFSSLTEVHEADWKKKIAGNDVQVFLETDLVLTPVSLSSLEGNSKIMGDYMFSDSSFILSNPDLSIVGNAMLGLSTGEFEDALIKVSPLSYASNPQVALQNTVQVAVVLDKQFQKEVDQKRKQNEKKEPCYGIPKTGLFIEPIGVFYHQKENGGSVDDVGQLAFDSYTYGAGLGWEQVLNEQFVVEGGVGYTHSNLHWKDGFGNSKWSTIYCAPFFGWFNKRFFANFMVMGGFNFFNTDRKITFASINRNAESKYNSYDLLLRVNAGARIPFGNINWFQPEATLNYLTIFTEGYTEKGASSINLQVKRRTTYIMQPSFRGKWIQEFKTKNFCYSPIIYAGWLSNIMLRKENINARFRDAPNRIFFNIQGYTQTTNQLILGAEFFVQKFNKFEITGTFEVDMLAHFEVYTGKIRFEWLF